MISTSSGSISLGNPLSDFSPLVSESSYNGGSIDDFDNERPGSNPLRIFRPAVNYTTPGHGHNSAFNIRDPRGIRTPGHKFNVGGLDIGSPRVVLPVPLVET